MYSKKQYAQFLSTEKHFISGFQYHRLTKLITIKNNQVRLMRLAGNTWVFHKLKLCKFSINVNNTNKIKEIQYDNG